MNQTADRATAIFVARAILGTVFFVAGLYKTFMWGPVAHSRELFVIPYADTFLPVWSLWLTGVIVPPVELVAGGLVLVGCGLVPRCWRSRRSSSSSPLDTCSCPRPIRSSDSSCPARRCS